MQDAVELLLENYKIVFFVKTMVLINFHENQLDLQFAAVMSYFNGEISVKKIV